MPGEAAITRSIAGAIAIKHRNLFFLSAPDGNLGSDGDHGLGLYHNDCRYLSSYRLQLGADGLETLAHTAEEGFMSTLELTNTRQIMPDGDVLEPDALAISVTRLVDGTTLTLYESLYLRNYTQQSLLLPLSLTCDADFRDIFLIRGFVTGGQPGRRHPAAPRPDGLLFRYDGGDGIPRQTCIRFDPPPERIVGRTAHYTLKIPPRCHAGIAIAIRVAEGEPADPDPCGPIAERIGRQRQQQQTALQDQTSIRTSDPFANEVIRQAQQDLQALTSETRGHRYLAAGLPWYGTLFGRDSLITGLQTQILGKGISDETLRLLAVYQGQTDDPDRNEAPGRILHELRRGELARLGRIPFATYYGSIDANALFLIALHRQLAWTGDQGLWSHLRETADRAIDWMIREGNLAGGGYLAYWPDTGPGLINKGWKDSHEAIVSADGRPAAPPVALIEVQAYAVWALELMAETHGRIGNRESATALRQLAGQLAERVRRDFWMPAQGCFALGLDGHGRQLAVVTSNAGHALWTGLASQEQAASTRDRLLAPDMFNGWGIRTMATGEVAYNPIGYHLGTVWPHDNALIAAGFRRYGFVGDACRLIGSLLDAALHFTDFQFPEAFGGMSRRRSRIPVPYPVAAHPHAWAAGSVPYMYEILLGLEPDAPQGRLCIRHPVLPDFLSEVVIERLRVGPASLDLRFHRVGDHVMVELLRQQGSLDVSLHLQPWQGP